MNNNEKKFFRYTPKLDYTKNYGELDKNDRLAKRRMLTAEFGSMKKNKFLEASLRRQVTEVKIIFIIGLNFFRNL